MTDVGRNRAGADSPRGFAWTMLGAGAVGAFLLHRKGVAWTTGGALVVVGLALVLLAYAAPALVRPLARAWLLLGHAIGKVTTPIMLIVVFVVVLVPTRALMLLLGKDPLERRRDPARASYWSERTRPRFGREDFERLS